jgi:hypothetical protein
MYATTIATNVILTAMISIRLYLVRRRLRCAQCRHLHQLQSQQQQQQQENPSSAPAPITHPPVSGSSSTAVDPRDPWHTATAAAAGTYTSIPAILIESAALFCVFGIASCALDLANASVKFAIIILWTSTCVSTVSSYLHHHHFLILFLFYLGCLITTYHPSNSHGRRMDVPHPLTTYALFFFT